MSGLTRTSTLDQVVVWVLTRVLNVNVTLSGNGGLRRHTEGPQEIIPAFQEDPKPENQFLITGRRGNESPRHWGVSWPPKMETEAAVTGAGHAWPTAPRS